LRYSIIIPTLNEEKLLPNLLKLLNTKDLKKKYDYEIIVSDGGSKDCTIEIASKFVDTVKIHQLPCRQNIAMGRNIGAQVANGDIFIFVNADVIIPDLVYFFEYLDANFSSSGNLAMTCRVKVFPEEEILIDKLFHTFYNAYFHLLNNLGMGMGRGECQVIRKEIFNKVCGYSEILAAGEDFDLFRRIRRLGKILFATELNVYESPRRYRKLGYRGVTFSWIKNSVSVILRNKSLSQEWEQVR
jgi:glycosyltransferase involved in cell wall biosynthesis